MYFPFYSGKQYELLAVREVFENKMVSELVMPVVEPVNESTRNIIKCAEELNKVGSGFILIVNPQNGHFERDRRSLDFLIEDLIDVNENMQFALWVHEGTSKDDLNYFFDKYQDHPLSLIHSSTCEELALIDALTQECDQFGYNFLFVEHLGRKYIDHLSKVNAVIVKDAFNKVARNADYPDSEFFHDLPFTYDEDGYVGFGDYSIVGKDFKVGGGRAMTAAIHITYEHNQEEEIWIRHFLSDERTTYEEVSILITEALGELADFLTDHPHILKFSSGCRELMNVLAKGEPTSLALIKKLSMIHHMELMHYMQVRR